MSEFLGEVGGVESECQRRGFHSVPPFFCDKALPLPCYVSPGKTFIPDSSRSAGRGQIQGVQLDLNAVISTGKEAKEKEGIKAKEEV